MGYNNLKDYVSNKKSNITKKTKNIAVAGVALATIAGGAMGLTGCNITPQEEIPNPVQPVYNNMHAQRIENYFKSKKSDFDMNYIYVRELESGEKTIGCMEIAVGGYEPKIMASADMVISEDIFDSIEELYEKNPGEINKVVICARDPKTHEITDRYITFELDKDAIYNEENNDILDIIYQEIRTNPTLTFTNYVNNRKTTYSQGRTEAPNSTKDTTASTVIPETTKKETTETSEITEDTTPAESTNETIGAELSNMEKIESILQGHIAGFQLDSIALRSNSTGEYWIEYRNGENLDALTLKNDIDLDTFGRMYAFAKAHRNEGMNFAVRQIRDNKLDKWVEKTCVTLNRQAMENEDIQPLLDNILLEMDSSTLSYVDDEKGMELFEK